MAFIVFVGTDFEFAYVRNITCFDKLGVPNKDEEDIHHILFSKHFIRQISGDAVISFSMVNTISMEDSLLIVMMSQTLAFDYRS